MGVVAAAAVAWDGVGRLLAEAIVRIAEVGVVAVAGMTCG